MSNPFDIANRADHGLARQQTAANYRNRAAEPATPAQLHALREMMLEKAQIKGMDMGAAENSVDAWLAKGLRKVYASEQILELGKWLDAARAQAARDREKAEFAGGDGVRWT